MSELAPAGDLAARNTIATPMSRRSIAGLDRTCSCRRSSCVARPSASPSSDTSFPGGEVPADYHFVAEDGTDVSFAELFGDHQTLAIYSFMFGPQREAPCPMCTSFMGGFDHKIADIRQRVAIAFAARSPSSGSSPQAVAWLDGSAGVQRHERRLHPRHVSADDADVPAYNVFTRAAARHGGTRLRHAV